MSDIVYILAMASIAIALALLVGIMWGAIP